jgi:hypothetical protein
MKTEIVEFPYDRSLNRFGPTFSIRQNGEFWESSEGSRRAWSSRHAAVEAIRAGPESERTLFDYAKRQREKGLALARSSDPSTAHGAADAITGKEAGRVERMVLDAMTRLGGSGTAYEIEVEVQRMHPGINSNTTSPRLKPLEGKRRVRRTDRRGPGRGNRQQIIWELAR